MRDEKYKYSQNSELYSHNCLKHLPDASVFDYFDGYDEKNRVNDYMSNQIHHKILEFAL